MIETARLQAPDHHVAGTVATPSAPQDRHDEVALRPSVGGERRARVGGVGGGQDPGDGVALREAPGQAERVEGGRHHALGHWPGPKIPARALGRTPPARPDGAGGAEAGGPSRPLVPGASPAQLRLPPFITACLFDLDGVLTSTAELHAEAWKTTFDRFLLRRALRTGEPYRPFRTTTDYDDTVDGKPRLEGTRSFLASRGIELPEGAPSDDSEAETVWGLANTKNALVQALIMQRGVLPYPGSVRFVDAVRAADLRTAVVSSSANTHAILSAAHLADRFEVVVDGAVAAQRHLAGKPAPDTFLAAAESLGVSSARAAVFEDSQAGVTAGHEGHFGFVVGVDRVGQAAALRACGADVVVGDLDELLDLPTAARTATAMPRA